MKVLVVIKRSPAQKFLVELHTKKVVKEVSQFMARRKNSQAIVTALTKGRIEREVFEGELPGLRADVILSEENVCWDLMK